MNALKQILAVTFAIAVVAIGTQRTVSLVLEMRHTDREQDARIDDLEQQLRDMRATADVDRAPHRPGPGDLWADDDVHPVPVAGSPASGPPDAWVTIVAFLDYQCPFCGRVQQTLADLRAHNPDVRIVVKHNPLSFHRQAMPAAVAAECANEQGAFWPLHRALFANQRSLDKFLSDVSWRRFDLDGQAMARCIAGSEAKAIVREDMDLARRMHAQGTPTFFVNGRRFVGAQPLEKFQQAVDRARTAAKASGIPAARYYADGVLAR